MGAFDSVANLISDMGTGLSSIFQNPNALYAAYFIAFFGIVYWIIFLGLSKAAIFKGQDKARKVIAIMTSIIVVGSVFYRYRSIEDLLLAMGGFIGTVLIFVVGIAFGALGVRMYREYKDKEKTLIAVILLSLCMYIASSIILPLFGFVSNFGGNMIAAGQNVWFYEVVITRFQALRVVGDMLAYIQMISAMVLIFSVLWLPFSLIKGSVSGMEITKRAVDPQDKRDIERVRRAIGSLTKRINNIDNTFKKMRKVFGGNM